MSPLCALKRVVTLCLWAGAVVPAPIGVNPFLTISAVSERIAERMPNHLA